LGMNVNILRRWKQEYTANTQAAFLGNGRLTPEQAALRQFRDEVKRLRMEREIVKKPCASLSTSRVAGCLYGAAPGYMAGDSTV
jgi:transposase-like protein